ncbi:MAG: leucine-rich repeat domain-containing protein [Paludibacter sp.]|jgi:hypothetical protein|nr:leucine-rich repeat domain-containing protein [Paludibacter sp.]
MRTTFLLLVLTVASFIHSQVIKTINVETAGTLSTILTEDEKSTITDLTVSGTIDARDIKCMRDQIANLTNIDLSTANIVAFEGIATSSAYYSYAANQMPRLSFYNGVSSKAKETLVSVILPNSLITIEPYAFRLCKNIKSIYIGNSITTIGTEAFEGCFGLTTVTMGNSVTTIQEDAFHYCYALNNLTLSENLTYIGIDAFRDCKIEKVSFPKSLTTINSAFRSNEYLTEVTLPATITNISNWAFQYCNALKTIYSLNPTPPVCETFSFSVVLNVTSVYVPESSVSAYKNAPIWGDVFYSQIKAIPATETQVQLADEVEIYSLNSEIVIDKTSKNEVVKVFSTTGQLFYIKESTGEQIIIPALKNNIYIVKTATKTAKILI